MQQIPVLFTRGDSIYKSLRGVDAWDKSRDALGYAGDAPVIAHPPCRAWGRLSGFSKHPPEEKELARFAVDVIRENGGILEHPVHSGLWLDKDLPLPGNPASPTEFTLAVDQNSFGHRAEKMTWLYINGITASELPDIPMSLFPATHVVNSRIRKGSPGWRPSITKREREATPPDFAEWLLLVARRIAAR